MNYNKQRNYCAALLRKVKKKSYGSLDEKHVTYNKTFWKTVKPFLSVNSPKIKFIERNEIINNEEKIAFFPNIASDLKILPYGFCERD